MQVFNEHKKWAGVVIVLADIVECGELLSEHLVINGHAEYKEY